MQSMVRLFLLPLTLVLMYWGSTPNASDMLLFDFQGQDSPRWTIEDDRVMGGRSQGYVEVEDGVLTFSGELVTRGGGFSSTRAQRRVDLTGYEGLERRVRGGGRPFEVDVDDGTRSRGREVNRRAAFPTESEWATVRIPFDSLKDTAHGEPVQVAPLDLSAIVSIGIYIADGQDGPFRLQVDAIHAYRDAD
ncbi:MAG: CIA30 family protein [Rhodothermales bacterium]